MQKLINPCYNSPMFTGIVEEIGKIQAIRNDKIEVVCNKVLEDLQIGDSVAVNGICLTVSNFNNKSFEADVSPETQRVTSLKNLKIGESVNLERAMPANGRFGGHIVSGHIDGLGKIKSIVNDKTFYNFEIEIDDSKYVVKKGSIAVNGISLTAADVKDNLVSIAVIPHTYKNTNLHCLKSGDFVNIEVDIMAKYVEKFLLTRDNKSGIDMDFLCRNGFC